MRKLIVQEMLSIDGYFSGVDGNTDWHNVGGDFNKSTVELSKSLDTILLGRKTYKGFEEYWPVALKDPKTPDVDRQIAQFIEDAKKVVVSKTLTEVPWNNSVIIKDNIEEEVQKLKEEEGKDIIIYGSGKLVKMLSEKGLIDEYIFIISPVVLGKGINVFEETQMKKLKLIESKAYDNGNVVNRYELK